MTSTMNTNSICGRPNKQNKMRFNTIQNYCHGDVCVRLYKFSQSATIGTVGCNTLKPTRLLIKVRLPSNQYSLLRPRTPCILLLDVELNNLVAQVCYGARFMVMWSAWRVKG